MSKDSSDVSGTESKRKSRGHNLKYMRKFTEAWPEQEIVQGSLAQITGYHNLALLEKCQSPDVRLWYAAKAIENGWGLPTIGEIEAELMFDVGDAP
jgi:hypothetical protein